MKLERISLRTIPLWVNTFDVAPLDVFVPSAGYGPPVSVESATHVPDDELEELLELELEELALLLELELELLELDDPPDDEELPPPQPATSAATPALPTHASALRRSRIWLEIV